MATGLPAALDALAALGGRLLVTDREALASWETDWRGRWTGRAAGLVQPGSVAEVQAVVRIAAEHRVALVPQGGNSSMVGGATPDGSGAALILSLRRLDRIRAIGERRATVEAGVVLQRLHEVAEDRGVRFPLTLGARGTATVGGLVSTAAGGTQVLRHGTMRALVDGLEVVLADGSLLSTLDPLAKDSRGPDPTALFVGGEGTLGIVTAATLKLVPRPAERAVAWLGLASAHDALAVLRSLEDRLPGQVEGFELIHRATVAAALAHRPAARVPVAADHAWHVLVEAVGETGVGDRLAEALGGDDRIADAALASSEAQADALWAIRDELSSAEKAWGAGLSFDLSVPVDALPDLLGGMERNAPVAFPDHSVSGFGHLGDGNIHLHIRAPAGADRQAWEAERGEAIARWVHDRIAAVGGSISAEHGIGQMKRVEHARLGDPVRLGGAGAAEGGDGPAGHPQPGQIASVMRRGSAWSLREAANLAPDPVRP